MKSKVFSISMIFFLIAFIITGCSITNENGPLINDSKTVDLGGANTAVVNIDIGAGMLKINGGSSALMDGKFSYNVENWKPELDYKVSNKSGSLSIKQPSVHDINLGNNKYEWDLSFNNNIPMDMDVNFGAGEADLNFSSLSLNNLKLKMGAGKITLDLAGKYKNNVNVNIDGGVGSATLYLPKGVGVKVSVTGGLGKINANGFILKDDYYVNDAYGKSKVTVNVDLKAGVGEVNLNLK